MLRSIANFFKPSSRQDIKASLNFPEKLLEEVNAEILSRQKFFLMCTLFTGLMTVGAKLGGLLFAFKHLHEKVNALSTDDINSEDLEKVADYYGYKASFYGVLPVGSLLVLRTELNYFHSTLKKYYFYVENTPVSELSPALYEKVKDYLRTIQYNPDDLTLEDLQEILIEESQQNNMSETNAVYYAI